MELLFQWVLRFGSRALDKFRPFLTVNLLLLMKPDKASIDMEGCTLTYEKKPLTQQPRLAPPKKRKNE